MRSASTNRKVIMNNASK
jgi:Leucine-rich repeat (LRR) protein